MTGWQSIIAAHGLSFGVILLAVVLLFLGRRAAASRSPYLFGSIACGLFGLGGLALSGWSFTFAQAGRLGFTSLKFDLATVVFALLLGVILAQWVLLLFLRVWSYRLTLVLLSLSLVALGGMIARPLNLALGDLGRAIRFLEFLKPTWLVLLVFVPWVFWVSRRSLSGLGSTRKWIALTARALAIGVLVCALAEPRIRRPSENITVIFVVDRSFSVPQELTTTSQGNTLDLRWERVKRLIEDSVRKRGVEHRNDQAGLIFFGKRPRLALPPTAVEWIPVDERMAGVIDGNYTDIAAAMKLALASFPEGNARRVVLISDGNENLGKISDQIELARKNGVQVDTVTLAPNLRNENEILITEVDAPPLSAEGERRLIRVALRNEHPTREVDGTLELIRVGRGEDGSEQVEQQVQIEIDATNPLVLDNSKLPARVRLMPRLNVFKFIDSDRKAGKSSYSYKASFVPLQSVEKPGAPVVAGLPGDRAANNRAAAAVVARGQRRILFLDPANSEERSPHRHLIRTLRDSRQRLDHLSADRLPADINDLGVFLSNYDCIILANVPAESFSNAQMEAIRSQVHDQGCGLVMVGGPESFGPGGYQQTPIEAALPVDCEVKAKRAMGKGGLVLIMHASEMADGNKWQKEIAKLAVQRLNPADMVGIVDYGIFGGTINWQVKFQEIGDGKQKIYQQVDKMTPGDMPDFDPFLQAAADTLSDPAHNLATKHIIVISDGDPNYSGPGKAAIQKMADNGITCTTVGVATHGVNEDTKMKLIASSTKDANGRPGNFYKVSNPNQLPAIYIKESRRISQSFIYDKPFTPQIRVVGGITDGLRKQLPPLQAFVRTTKKESPLCDMLIDGPPDKEQEFPILATWRYGLGKAVAFTSDARSQPNGIQGWDRDWVASDVYTKFWEQTVNWAMREAERGRLALMTEYREGKVRVRLDAQDDKGKPVGGLILKGAVTPPNKPGPGEAVPSIEFKPIGNGMYEAEIRAEEAGSYFVNVQASVMKDGKLEAFDAARAGVAVPYSPEFADLESNFPLMKQIAESTGGKVFTDQDNLDDLAAKGEFFRPAPEIVRAILPFWFWLVFAAAIFLLVDVATRRIAIELKDLRTWSQRTWARLRAHPEAVVETEELGALMKRKQSVSDTLARKKAARKFEVEESAPAEAAPEGADDYARRTASPPPSPGTPTSPPPTLKPADEDDDGDDYLTRMRKAKERGKKKQGD